MSLEFFLLEFGISITAFLLVIGFMGRYVYVFTMANQKDNLILSIVIPVLNERDKIRDDIKAATDFLQMHNIRGEIIIVDDGSTDDTVLQARSMLPYKDAAVLILEMGENRGKGFAIRQGVAASAGKMILFADSGHCVPFAAALPGMDMISRGERQIVIASRKLAQSVIVIPQSLQRRISSWLFRIFTVVFMRVPTEIKDTQCGFKLFEGDIARDLFAKCRSDGFMLDIELILRARKRGLRIEEVPVQWTCDRDSRLSVHRILPNVLRELWAIKKAV